MHFIIFVICRSKCSFLLHRLVLQLVKRVWEELPASILRIQVARIRVDHTHLDGFMLSGHWKRNSDYVLLLRIRIVKFDMQFDPKVSVHAYVISTGLYTRVNQKQILKLGHFLNRTFHYNDDHSRGFFCQPIFDLFPTLSKNLGGHRCRHIHDKGTIVTRWLITQDLYLMNRE